MPNPYENYNLLDYLSDIPYSDVPSFFTSGHIGYYNRSPEMIREMRPDLAGPRVDRNMQDMMLNFIGGYDMAARGMDPERAAAGARAYQYMDYLRGREEDAAGDYMENVAGIQAFNPEVGRLPDMELIRLAEEFARKRVAKEQ